MHVQYFMTLTITYFIHTYITYYENVHIKNYVYKTVECQLAKSNSQGK